MKNWNFIQNLNKIKKMQKGNTINNPFMKKA